MTLTHARVGTQTLIAIASAVGVILTSAAQACTSDPVVLATLPEADAGSTHSGPRCVLPTDCAAGTYCSRHECQDQAGVCVAYPANCGNEEHPVCGCDGITYFNDCLRRASGVAAATIGACEGGATCGDDPSSSCPSGAVCARLLGFNAGPAGCGPDARGMCWLLPDTCPAPSLPDRWDECSPIGEKCVDTCTAIKNGEPHVRVSHCN